MKVVVARRGLHRDCETDGSFATLLTTHCTTHGDTEHGADSETWRDAGWRQTKPETEESTAERSDRSFLVAFQNYKFNCATENSKLLLSVFVTESVVMAGILNTTFVHSTHSET